MNVTQTVEIPPSHKLAIDVPREVPTGRAIITFTPLSNEPQIGENGKIRITKKMREKFLQGETLRFLTGILHNDIGVDIERIREERLAKFLK